MDEVDQSGHAPPASPVRGLDAEILDRVADAVLIADAEGRYVEANLAATILLGYSRAELLSMSVPQIVTWPVERAETEFERLLTDGSWRGEIELRRKDGSTVAVEANASIFETEAGRWGLAILREPDPEHRTLVAAERRLAAIVRSSDDAIYSATPDGIIDAWNPAAERLYGYLAGEIVGKHVSVTVPAERRAEVVWKMEIVNAGQHIRGFETVRLTKGGQRIDVSLTVSPIFDADGSVTGMSTIARDIGERIRAERWTRSLAELGRALEDAESEEDLFDAALDALQRSLQAPQGGFLIADDDGTARFRAWRGLPPEAREALEQVGWWREAADQAITVTDVDLDRRLTDHREALEKAGIRSLIVLPLVHVGVPIGAAVVCSDRPRELPHDEMEFATALAAQVGVAVARLRAEGALATARDTLDLLTVGAADGITVQDSTGRVVYANLAAARLSGYDSVEAFLTADPSERLADSELLDESGDPFPVDRLPGRRVLSGEREAETVMRVHDRRTGHEFWSMVRATATFDAAGDVRHAINVFHDITSQKDAERTLQRQATRMAHLYAITATLSSTTDRAVIAEALADLTATAFDADRGGVVLRSEDGEHLETIAWRGFDPAAIERWETFPLDRRTPVGEAVLENEPVVMPDRRDWAERYPDIDVAALPAAAAAIPLDVGGRALGGITMSFDEARTFDDEDIGFMVAAARQGAQALERARLEAGRRLVEARLSVLAQAGDLLAQSLDYPRTLAAVVDLVVPRLADWASVEILEPDGSIRSLALAHMDPDRVAFAEELRRRRPPDINAPSGTGHVIATGQPELVPDITEEMLAAADDAEPVQLVRELQLRSSMIVPLSARGRTLGAMTYVWAESGHRYSEADLRFALTLAARCALVIDNARLYRDRDHVAKTLQQSLLPPELPEIAGADLAARYRPSGEGIDVGGDFYDAFDIGDGEWTMALGDVCGKGPDAAALMGMVRNTIRAAAIRERAPARILGTVNTAIGRQFSAEQFCTAVGVRIRPQDGRLMAWLAVAGHPAPLLLREDGSIAWIRPTGSLLGVFDDAELSDVEISMGPGDTLVLYTDGVTEVRDDDGEFGEAGLAEAVSGAAGRSASGIADAIEEAIRAKDPGEPRDDIAILVVRATG